MAMRPVFEGVVNDSSWVVVRTHEIEFKWAPGLAVSQKRKNVKALHEGFVQKTGTDPAKLLEVSRLCESELGTKLSAFNLQLDLEMLLAKLEGRKAAGSQLIPLESCYQGAKCMDGQPPFEDILLLPAKAAKKDPRIKEGSVTGFRLGKVNFPLFPKTAFYNFIYIAALAQPQNRELLEQVVGYSCFTDLNYNPAKGVNCQAHAMAMAVALYHRGLLDKAMESFSNFMEAGYGVKKRF